MPVNRALPFACLEEPERRGLGGLRPWLVDRLKGRAIHHLHASRRGELLLLRMYLIGERATELSLQQGLLPSPPPWLKKQMAWHLAEEQAHVRLFAEQMAERGEIADLDLPPDWISQRKIRQWHAIARRYLPLFSQGVLVPAYAVGLCAEQMARRVLNRHRRHLDAAHPFQPLLGQVLRDEEKHIRLCRRTLERIVLPAERPLLLQLIAEVRQVEQAWGVRSALLLYLAGVALRGRAWLQGPAA